MLTSLQLNVDHRISFCAHMLSKLEQYGDDLAFVSTMICPIL